MKKRKKGRERDREKIQSRHLAHREREYERPEYTPSRDSIKRESGTKRRRNIRPSEKNPSSNITFPTASPQEKRLSRD